MAPADDRLALLLRSFRAQVPTPGWTDSNEPDPGVSLVGLLAYLAEQLESRSAELPASARAEAARIGLQLARLDPDGVAAFTLDAAKGRVRFGDGVSGHRPADGSDLSASHPTGGGAAGHVPAGPAPLERPNYFTGQLLTVDDLALEQAYVREKLRRLHRASFDAGVIAGLEVTVDHAADPPSVVVSPGTALDPQGELIVLDCELRFPMPTLAADGRVLLRYVERVSAFAPPGVDGRGDGAAPSRRSRIVEGAAISIADSMDEGAVLLARLTQSDGKWTASAPDAAPE